MNKIMTLLCVVCCVMHALCDIPFDKTSGVDFYEGEVPKWRAFRIEGMPASYGCVIVPYDNAAGDVNVPSQLGGRPVLGLGKNAFYNTKVTSVVLPEGLLEIGEGGFRECGTLRSITLPSSMTNIGIRAFIGCTNLLEIVIPDGVHEIRDECFKGCLSLQSVLLFGPTNVGYYAFSGCANLSSVILPEELRQIGDGAFSGCSCIQQITVPCKVTAIEGGSFSGCTSLMEVSFQGEGLRKVGNSAFANCRNITDIVFPSSLKEIGGGALANCYRLTNVVFNGDAPFNQDSVFNNSSRDLVIRVPVGSKGWDGNPESTALPKYWPFNTEGGRRIVHIGDPIEEVPPVITNFVYTTVTNYVIVTNAVFHYSTVTNEIHHYTTVTNVVKYVPEPGTSPDAGYAIGAGESRELAIAGAAGWDAFGVPGGMEWDKATGTLSGQAKLSGTYDVMLVSGSGADTQIMRTTITVAPFDKSVGYVGVAFSQGGTPLDILKSYKTLPAGLKWKDGVLSGVPTKAQTLNLETVDGEPVTIEIKALPDAVVGTFDGCIYLPPSIPTNGVVRPCDIIGTVSLTMTAAGKISASVKTAQKTYSSSATSWTKIENGNVFTLESRMTLKTGEALQVNAYVGDDGAAMVLVELSGGVFGGGIIGAPLPGCVTEVVKDIYAKVGGKWPDEAAHALMAKCAGTYLFGFDRIEAPEPGESAKSIDAWTLRSVKKQEAAFLKVVVKDTGAATITGTLPDKTKINCTAKATAEVVDGQDASALRITTAAFSGKTITIPLSIGIKSDKTPISGSDNCGSACCVKR